MKKLLFGLIGLAFLAGGSTSADAKTIGVALASDSNPFYIAMLKGIKKQAKARGFDVSVVNAEEDLAKQLNGINDLIAKGVDGILISPIDAKALCSAYDNAKKAGIPMMSIARGSTCKSQFLHITMDEEKIGGEVADWIAKAIGNKGEVAMLAGPAGAQAFINVAKGFTSAMAKHKDIKIVFRRELPLTRENGLKNAEDALVARPNLRAIYGANDELGLGAAQAVIASGKKGKVVVTGMNGIPPARVAVRKGVMGLTVALNPVAWGTLGANTMADHLSGKKFDRRVYVGHLLVDKNNVHIFFKKK